MPEESVSGCRYKPTFSAEALGNEYAAWVSRQGIYTTKTLTEDLTMNSRDRRTLRYRAKCAAERIESVSYIKRIDNAFTKLSEGCTKRVVRAVAASEASSRPDYRQQLESRSEAVERKNHKLWYKQPGERGVTCSGRQKLKLSSKPLI